MSKLNHKYLLMAVLAVSPLVALSPSKMIVRRTMASLDQSGSEVLTDKDQEIVNIEAEAEAEVKNSIEKVVREEAASDTDKVEEKVDKEKTRQCSARDEVENLEKEVKKVVGENMKLIERFEKLNAKYDDQLKVTKQKASEVQGEQAMGQSDLILMSLLSMILQNQQQVPSYSYLPSAFSYAPQFTGPGWNFLPNHTLARAPGSYNGYTSWENEYYNIPSLGFVNPELTPKADSLTTGLYPAIYTSNGTGRALRSVHDIAPARGYTPSFLSPMATSSRQAQSEGFPF